MGRAAGEQQGAGEWAGEWYVLPLFLCIGVGRLICQQKAEAHFLFSEHEWGGDGRFSLHCSAASLLELLYLLYPLSLSSAG